MDHYPLTKAPHTDTHAHRHNLHTHSNVQGHMHRGPYGVSFECVPHRETDAAKDFAFIDRKNEGTTFVVEVLSVTLSLSPQVSTSSLSLSLCLSTRFYLYLTEVGSREGTFPETR